jgi:hypothetical protein
MVVNLGCVGEIGHPWLVLEEEVLEDCKFILINFKQSVDIFQMDVPFIRRLTAVLLRREVLLIFENSFEEEWDDFCLGIYLGEMKGRLKFFYDFTKLMIQQCDWLLVEIQRAILHRRPKILGYWFCCEYCFWIGSIFSEGCEAFNRLGYLIRVVFQNGLKQHNNVKTIPLIVYHSIFGSCLIAGSKLSCFDMWSHGYFIPFCSYCKPISLFFRKGTLNLFGSPLSAHLSLIVFHVQQ